MRDITDYKYDLGMSENRDKKMQFPLGKVMINHDKPLSFSGYMWLDVFRQSPSLRVQSTCKFLHDSTIQQPKV